jgi:hypothetical protein
MTITRADVEAELVSRQKSRMEAVNMSLLFSGSNLDLNSSIGYAVRQCGGTVASLSSVSNSDLATVTDDLDKLIDIAEYRLLLSIKGRWGRHDITAGQLTEKLSQFADDLDSDIDRKRSELAELYGFGSGLLEAGTISLNFAEKYES